MFTAHPDRSPTQNAGYRHVFRRNCLTFGLGLPIEAFEGDQPTMADQAALVQAAESGGFHSVGFRDVPLRDPGFGDSGQVYDPWVYLGYMAAQTREIALFTTSIVLPLRHPIHTAKAAASVDQLSGGRLLLGVATGDRMVEFPAFGVDAEARGERFREQFPLLRAYWSTSFRPVRSRYGDLLGADVIPKPVASHVPLFVTGQSRSDLEWIAAHADGWMTYPRSPRAQGVFIQRWRDAVEAAAPGACKPFVQSLFLDLADDPDMPPERIHLGWRIGRNGLIPYLEALRTAGVDHLIFNLKYGRRPARDVLQELAEHVLPAFR